MDYSKIAVIGAGNVGAAIANALVLKNIGREIILFNRDKDKAIAEAMDIDDTIPLLSEMQVKASNNFKDLKECAVIIVTIGAKQKKKESRLELLERNASIIKSLVKELDSHAPNSVIIIVSNPVDILTRIAQETTKRNKLKIFGSGTVLDTSRIRYQVGKDLNVNRKNVHIHVIGEHGDSEFAVWSNAIIGSVKLDEFPLQKGQKLDKMKKNAMDIVKTRAYEIIERKGYTNFGIAVAVVKLVQCVIRDERKIFSVSVSANEEYQLEKNTVLSLPCILGKDGIVHKLTLSYNQEEKQQLEKAAKSLNNAYRKINL